MSKHAGESELIEAECVEEVLGHEGSVPGSAVYGRSYRDTQLVINLLRDQFKVRPLFTLL